MGRRALALAGLRRHAVRVQCEPLRQDQSTVENTNNALTFPKPVPTVISLGLALLLLSGVLDWEDILKAKSAWDTLIWFAALVMMATFLGKLGLIAWFSLSIQNGINYLGLGWVSATIILVLVYFYSHYFFASTTAHITAMFGAFFAAGTALGAPPMPLALLLAFSSSLMMSLTHYGTGTEPIIFGSG